MIRAAHLLDDFAMGGVTRFIGCLNRPEFTSLVTSEVHSISRNAVFAPKLKADMILTHVPPSWKRLLLYRSLRHRNPRARLVHVEHSYTRAFERHCVPNPGRFRRMIRLALKPFDEVICVSDGQRQWMTETVGLDARKCRTIHPVSGREELLSLPPSGPDQDGPLRLAAYGRYSDVKNYAALIEAVGRFPRHRVTLALAGSGPDDADLRIRAAHHDNVTVCGPVENIGEFLAAADAVIVPSRWESFGLVAIEARLAGRPILVADVDGLPEQVGGSGLATPMKTAEEIEAAIARFAAMPISNMGMKGREDARADIEKSMSEWQALFSRAQARDGQ